MVKTRNKFKLVYLWIKEFFIPCRLRKRYWDDQPFLICGHRGSPAKEPENTIESFEKAIKDGANSLELDLCLTKDEEIIVWHDWDPNDLSAMMRANGFEPDVKFKPAFNSNLESITDFTLAETGKHLHYIDKSSDKLSEKKIPTLKDFFEWSKNKSNLLYVFLDLKIPPDKVNLVNVFMDTFQNILKDFNPSYKIVIESEYKAVVDILKKDFPDFSYCLDIEPPLGFIFLPRLHSAINAAIKKKNKYALAIKPRQVTIGSWITHRRIINYDVRRRARFNKKNHDKKIEYLLSCTINDASEMECLIKLGIGGIQTDFPGLLRQVAERMGRKIE